MSDQTRLPDNHTFLVPDVSREQRRLKKDAISRTAVYADYLDEHGRDWSEPDLIGFGDYLTDERGVSRATRNVYVSGVKTRLRELLEDGSVRQAVEGSLPDALPSEREQKVQEVTERIRREINNPDLLLRTKRPRVPYPRLKARNIVDLLNQPDPETGIGLRDRAIIIGTLTAGLRVNELVALDVSHLYSGTPAQPMLHVPAGRGCVERDVPWWGMSWGLREVEEWLHAANIDEGPVFRGFLRDGQTLKSSRLSPRAVEYALRSYPIEIDGELVTVTPMDLRRAYARILFEMGIELEDIMASLGLQDSRALLDYIGPKDASLETPAGWDFTDPSTFGLKEA